MPRRTPLACLAWCRVDYPTPGTPEIIEQDGGFASIIGGGPGVVQLTTIEPFDPRCMIVLQLEQNQGLGIFQLYTSAIDGPAGTISTLCVVDSRPFNAPVDRPYRVLVLGLPPV